MIISLANLNTCLPQGTKRKRLYLEQIKNQIYSQVKSQEWGAKEWNTDGAYGILRKRDGNRSDLVYIYNPKTGSETMRFAMRGEFEGNNALSNAVILKKSELKRLAGADQHNEAFVFTTVRHPDERITSAYSTMIHRLHEKGWAHRNEVSYNITPWPESSTDISAWEDHFQSMVHTWMETIARFGWGHSDFWWDQHLIPQYEYLRGYNISHICCTDSLEECFPMIGIPKPKIIQNSYEKAKFMPEKKFQSFEMLRKETKSLIHELYRDDYVMYDIFCGNVGKKNALKFACTQQL
jgi:hypothetical protein